MTTGLEAQLAATYDDFGRNWAHGTSPLYEDWAIGVGRDPELIARIATLPPLKRQPNLLFASARSLGVPLDAWEHVREWFADEWDAVVAVASRRSTQTNEPNRCATWLPPLSAIDGPIALLEVGTAAGLCLYPDRYGYDYTSPAGHRRLEPALGSPVALACEVDDDASLPDGVPEVVWRTGIDLSPIDAGDADAMDWLALLVWPGPDHDARVARLRAAAAVVAADPPRIVQGDLLERVTDVAAAAPRDATLVVFHSAVLLYLDDAGRARFAAIMASLGDTIGRDVVWLSNEVRGNVASAEALMPARLDTHHRFVQTQDGVPIALAGQHGATYQTRPFASWHP